MWKKSAVEYLAWRFANGTGDCFLRLLDFNHFGIGPPEAQVIAPDGDLDWIAEG